jgi:hypothetical protein
MSVNHRLSAREHLAEAAALHGEGAMGPSVLHLRAAAVEAVAALAEPGDRLVPPGAAARLAHNGIGPDGVRDLLAELHLDCAMQERGHPTELTPARLAQAIAAVQQLADLATGVPTAAVPARVGARWGTGDLPPVDEAVRLPAMPQRPGEWLKAARRRRMRSRAIAVLVPLSTVAAVIGVGITIAVGLPERPSPHRLQVLSRTSELTHRVAPRHDVR